ncbi:MAG: zinc-dependent alcohol dehydrogenase family protein [Firmicutes bacterium]|jgi:2-desacetyl-2-hydroxyethyl bacteriochlorophyllide A dehydrogenase|nr:zinc-dependent alcohol dehydrogenase family protein [Bacillota bacterium]MDH7494730.1 zinc-dependent alcohol dehydrogenase family protein [Bacillota bacterium]
MEDKTMLAAVFEGDGKLAVREVPVPTIRKDDEVLLRVDAASICGTDVHILEVPPGHPATPGSILGHEYVGTVLEVGTGVAGLREGDRVVVDPNLTCGRCRYCRMGMPNMCENMTTLGIFMDGGFATYNVAPAQALHKISKAVPPDAAVFAEPLSCVVNGTEKVRLHPGESVVVLGAGPIGLLFIQVFRAAGAGRIIVSEVAEVRAEAAKRSGADLVIDPRSTDVKARVMAETGIGADVVVDAVGALLPAALDLVRRGGKVLLFGMNQSVAPPVAQYYITRHEVAVLGTYIAKYTFPPAIKVLESGAINTDALITHRVGVANIIEGFEAMRSGKAVKVVVTPD